MCMSSHCVIHTRHICETSHVYVESLCDTYTAYMCLRSDVIHLWGFQPRIWSLKKNPESGPQTKQVSCFLLNLVLKQDRSLVFVDNGIGVYFYNDRTLIITVDNGIDVYVFNYFFDNGIGTTSECLGYAQGIHQQRRGVTIHIQMSHELFT